MERREFTITGGGVNLKAYEGITNNTSVLLNELKGWDEDTTLEVVTKPKLFGNGSYIVSERFGERTIEATIFFNADNAPAHVADAGIRFVLVSPLRTAYKNRSNLTLKRVYKDAAGATVITQSITGRINQMPTFIMHTDGSVQMTVEFLCTNPDIITT